MSSNTAPSRQQDTNIKIPLISKIAYGMGDVGCNFSWMFVGNFLMIFYTDVCGISMAAVSLLMLVSRFWDAINDPVIGSLSDRTRTRWGRYRPWLLIGAPLTAVVLVLTFWAHPAWPDRAKSLYMYITYCVLVLGYTCVNIPYGTLCGTLTQNIEERAKINTSRSVCAMIAINILNIITLPLISHFGGDNAAHGYLMVTVLYGGIFTLCHWFCFAKTKEVVQPPRREKVSLKKQFQAAAQNRPYLIALAGQFLFGVTLYGRNADLLYYFKYVEGNENLFTVYSLILIVPSILGAAVFPFVFEKLGNKGHTAALFSAGTGVSLIALYFFSAVSPPRCRSTRLPRSRSSSSAASTPRFTPSCPTAWSTASGKPACATTASSTPLCRSATSSAWPSALRHSPAFWALCSSSPIRRRMPPCRRACTSPSR